MDKPTIVTSVSPANVSNSKEAPLYSSQPSAGFPAPGDDMVEKALDLNDLLVENETSTFLCVLAETQWKELVSLMAIF